MASVMAASRYGIRDGFLYLSLDQNSCEWPEGLVQNVALRTMDRELE